VLPALPHPGGAGPGPDALRPGRTGGRPTRHAGQARNPPLAVVDGAHGAAGRCAGAAWSAPCWNGWPT
jgi:hypothetical protein